MPADHVVYYRRVDSYIQLFQLWCASSSDVKNNEMTDWEFSNLESVDLILAICQSMQDRLVEVLQFIPCGAKIEVTVHPNGLSHSFVLLRLSKYCKISSGLPFQLTTSHHKPCLACTTQVFMQNPGFYNFTFHWVVTFTKLHYHRLVNSIRFYFSLE